MQAFTHFPVEQTKGWELFLGWPENAKRKKTTPDFFSLSRTKKISNWVGARKKVKTMMLRKNESYKSDEHVFFLMFEGLNTAKASRH